MASNKRLFLFLWLAGIAGVLSLLLVDIAAVVRALPLPAGTPPPELPPPALLKLATIMQPAVLTTLAVFLGMWLAPKVGLRAPAARAFADRKPIWPELGPQILPGILSGVAGGAAIVITWIIAKPLMPAEFVARALEFNNFVPHVVRILYGGFTEEILLRWGVMTFLVWLFWRVLQRGVGEPRSSWFVAAIILSALLFGAGHLPIASALAGGLTLPIVIYVLVANSMFGVVAGFLYWRRGLESAMLAHMFAHVVLIAAISFQF
jgi:membrane protease YdiL (CAAX protease family)